MGCGALPSTSASDCEWAQYAQSCPTEAAAAFGGIFGSLELGSLNLVCGNLGSAASGYGQAAGTALNETAGAAGSAVSSAVSGALGVPSWLAWVLIAAAGVVAIVIFLRLR